MNSMTPHPPSASRRQRKSRMHVWPGSGRVECLLMKLLHAAGIHLINTVTCHSHHEHCHHRRFKNNNHHEQHCRSCWMSLRCVHLGHEEWHIVQNVGVSHGPHQNQLSLGCENSIQNKTHTLLVPGSCNASCCTHQRCKKLACVR